MISALKNKSAYWTSVFIIFLMLYRNSWLPGATSIQGKEGHLIFFITFCFFLFAFDFSDITDFLSREVFSRFNKYYILVLAIFSISILVFNFQEISQLQSILYIYSYIAYVIMYFFILAQVFYLHDDLFANFIKLIFYTGAVLSILAILFVLIGVNPIEKYSGMTISLIVHPNYISFFYTTAIITTVYYLHSRYSEFSFIKKSFVLTSLFSLLIAQLFTYCRGGYIATIGGIGLFYLFYFKKKIFYVLPFGIGLMILLLPAFFKSKGAGSFVSRLLLLIPAYHMLAENKQAFFWGYGALNNFEMFDKYKLIYGIQEENVSNPHNSIVQTILMFGIIFTSLIWGFLAGILSVSTVRLIKNYFTENRTEIAFLISVQIALILQGLFDSALTFPAYFNLQFLLLFSGLLFRFIRKKTNSIFVLNRQILANSNG